MANFNERFKKFRKRANLTQAQVAEKLGISRQAYSKYENSDIIPGIARLSEILGILGTDFDEFLYEETLRDEEASKRIQEESKEFQERYGFPPYEIDSLLIDVFHFGYYNKDPDYSIKDEYVLLVKDDKLYKIPYEHIGKARNAFLNSLEQYQI